MEIRTRFAPSPTGSLHIGSVRTALYAWLYARANSGKFLLRIDDTDIERSDINNVNNILDVLYNLGLNWDEGPYFQTKRLSRYNDVINMMLVNGNAYRCFCSKERLQKLREFQISIGEKPRYDGFCRDKSYIFNDNINSSNSSYVVRFYNPKCGKVIFRDKIRGTIVFNNNELDDFIIRRTDGMPTYNFCVVIDDFDMKITHVIRGEDHLNNTPRQINIFRVLGFPVPEYAHVSMIIGEDGKKFSKRHGNTGIMYYLNCGFLPEALLNYLVRLGWSYGDQELFTVDLMKQFFNLSSVSKSPSMFSIKKLNWINHYYINNLPVDYIACKLRNQFDRLGINIDDGPQLIEIIKLYGPRYKNLQDIAINCTYLYKGFDLFNSTLVVKYLDKKFFVLLKKFRERLMLLDEWRVESLVLSIKIIGSVLKIDMNIISMFLRVILFGVVCSPKITSVMCIFGKQRLLQRVDKALYFIACHI